MDRMHKAHSLSSILVPLAVTVLLAACGSSGNSGSAGVADDPTPTNPAPPAPETPEPAPPEPEPPESEACEGEDFDSTFDAVQTVVFERYACLGCHAGDNASGGLDLSPDVAWENLHDVPSQINGDPLVAPGAARRSMLYQKLAAATLGEETAGSPMPVSGPAITEDELELVYWWIYGGGPEEGVVLDALPYVPGCLPEPGPLAIKPLPVPGPGEGIQLEMPEFVLPAGLEVERCFAQYYDVCDQVPDELKRDDGYAEVFAFSGRELRMDPGSHHLILNYSLVGPDQLDDPSFGAWTCAGGEQEGESCEPTDLEGCGLGHCVSTYRDGFTCSGYGPAVPGAQGRSRFAIGGAQRAQDLRQYPEGVFNEIPCRGTLNWNPHAFNLTNQDQRTHGRLNYYFADAENLRYPNRGGLTGPIFIAAGTPPFTKATYCATHTFPRGTRLYELSSHTHKHGEYFWINGPDGNLLYENHNYNDPDTTLFAPALEYDSENPDDRTFEFCATYNNGVKEDGSPDVELVTRASRVPASARVPGSFGTCEPVACVNPGMEGQPCSGEDDDASCDTPGGPGGDGECDACPITAGESTENEMFLMIPAYYVVEVD